MNINNSPWIEQLQRTIPLRKISQNSKTEIVIVGGGIAGITTAFFILKNSNYTVTLLEAGRVACGATGYNAGQVVSYFERQISLIAEEFGTKLAIQAQADLLSAWSLMEEIFRESKLQTPFYQFTGYAGISDFDKIIIHLKNSLLLHEASLMGETLLVAEESEIAKRIPQEYHEVCTFLPHKDILTLLETTDTQYVAALTARKGCLNSALFTEELASFLVNEFKDRFTLFEESPIHEVVLGAQGAQVKTGLYVVDAQKVVLCTNGFENFTLTNTAGSDIDTKFHHLITGTVGYMAGYLEERNKSPIAVSYITDTDNYFYMTRRPFEYEKNQKHNLICIGGPESYLEDTSLYKQNEHVYPEQALQDISDFLHKTYDNVSEKSSGYTYHWHGLMGYTPNGIRLVGTEPRNNHLLYNLGCNGVGILPSVFGAKKIADILNNKQFPSSIFDPK